jgi:hypothetical protein
MSLVVIGDVHGYTKTYQKFVRKLHEGQRSVQIGDMGLGFAGVGLPAPGQPPLGDSHKFFRGNHDSPEKCRAHKNHLGDFGYLPDDKLFWCAGAYSIDRDMRVEGQTWWPDEELSNQELEKAIDLYALMLPRFVLSHEAPEKASKVLLYDLQGAYFSAKLECTGSRTAQALQIMLDIHQPEEFVFGHYHVDKQFYVPGYKTKFVCVGGIMQDGEQPHTYELNTDK